MEEFWTNCYFPFAGWLVPLPEHAHEQLPFLRTARVRLSFSAQSWSTQLKQNRSLLSSGSYKLDK
jgi:hypothetical protein